MNDIGALALIRQAATAITLPQRPIRVLGVDLGTTNSTVAKLRWTPEAELTQEARCLEVDQQTYEGLYTHVLVPSVVAIHDGKVMVGEGAKRLRARAPELGLRQNQNLFYECKNDIGIQKTYHRVPEGFRSAAEIGGKVLEFLYRAALEYDPTPVQRVVVTVPASFQGAQRVDTVKAAGLANLQLTGGALLDEPVAAFMDYVQAHDKTLLQQLVHPKNLVVFDFGGGTCDVAVFQVLPDRSQGQLQIAPLAVSRYHRLGGGDIDTAVVHEVLLPQLCEQNGLAKFDLGFEDKKYVLEPALVGMAEALKIGLCTEIQRLRSFDQYDRADKAQILKKQPGVYTLQWKDRPLSLQGPSLFAAQFEELLKPFLDRDLLYARETEYRLTCSVFAPLQDALDRSSLGPQDIDYCLMVGGSSLIPQVQDAIRSYFPRARLLTYEDRDSFQVAVARGAACHALALELFGRGLVKPVTNDAIAIRSAAGLVTLIPERAELPYPPDGSYRTNRALAVPQTTLTGFCLGRVLRSKNAPDAWLLNKMAIYYGEMGGFEREEKFYREAAASSWAIPWFNLALSQHKRGLYAQAATILDKALLTERKAPYLVLRAQIYGSLGDRQQQEKALQEAMQEFGTVASLDAWELGWFLDAARMAGDHEKLSQGEKRRLIEILKVRLAMGEKIAILLPQNRQVYGFAKGLRGAGLDVETPKGFDFSTDFPKIMPFHSAKGLTFETVLMSRLVPSAFAQLSESRIERLFFVGITRATKWVYMNTTGNNHFSPLEKLAAAESKGCLTVQLPQQAGIKRVDQDKASKAPADDLTDLL